LKHVAPGLKIRNGRVLLPNGRIVRKNLLLAKGRIAGVGVVGRGGTVLDAAGAYVVPGLIDIHTHGVGYESTNGSLKAYAEKEASRGTTTFYPSFFGPPGETAEHMRRHLRETDNLRALPQIGGFRLESPYLNWAGGGVSKDLAPVSPATTRTLLKAGGGSIRLWDFSPELPGATETIAALSRSGIVCSLAHMRCTVDQARHAVDAGARLVTHLFDTFEQPRFTEPGVYPAGVVDYFLVEDRITCEIIPDGTHVNPLHVEKTFRCKPAERVVFVTDSNFGAGLPPGDYDLPQGWGRARISGANNGVRVIERGLGLAGSALTPIDAFQNAIRLFGRDMATASRLCSKNAADLLGLNKGEIVVGRDADLTILDSNLDVRHTIVGGSILFSRHESGLGRP
jgi:N-acetylglucosamine-6-phosphate deacetylase